MSCVSFSPGDRVTLPLAPMEGGWSLQVSQDWDEPGGVELERCDIPESGESALACADSGTPDMTGDRGSTPRSVL